MQTVSYETCALLKCISDIGSNPKRLFLYFSYYFFFFLTLRSFLYCLNSPSPSSPAPSSVSSVLVHPLMGLTCSTPNVPLFFCLFIFSGVSDEVHCILVDTVVLTKSESNDTACCLNIKAFCVLHRR